MFSFYHRSSHRLPSMRVAIFGDSLVRSLKSNATLFSDQTNIFCYPGATIQSLRHSIPRLSYTPDLIILHVGTNSCAQALSKTLQQAYELKERVRTVATCTHIYFSLVLPRWDCDYLYGKCEKINQLFIHFKCLDVRDSVKRH